MPNRTITVAAINYVCDQNAPSTPYLLDLTCPDEPTLEQFKEVLAAHYLADCVADLAANAVNYAHTDPEDRPSIDAADVVVEVSPGWGHFSVSDRKDCWPILFVGVPAGLAKRFGLR